MLWDDEFLKKFFVFFCLKSKHTYYEILQVTRSADQEALRKAFCRLSKILHPDTTALPPLEAAEQFQLVCEAYEVLGDCQRRFLYDKDLEVDFLERQDLKLKRIVLSPDDHFSSKKG